MKKKFLDLRKSNKGFSLVELVVAVAILVLVSLPFAVAFITATRINGTARNKERANTAATSEMEYLRAANLLELTDAAEGAGSSGAQVVLSKSTLASGASGSSDEIVGTLVSNHEKNVTTGIKMSSYDYTRDVTVDGKPFHIEANLNPFGASGAATSGSSKETAYYNNDVQNDFPVITSNTGSTNLTDAQFSISTSTDNNMASQLADYYWPGDQVIVPSTDISGVAIKKNSHTADVLANMKRDIIFKITNTAKGSGKYLTEVKVSVKYTYQPGVTPYSVNLPEKIIYSNLYSPTSGVSSTKNSNLQNIYVYYNGNAKSRTTNLLDSIYIVNDNANKVPINFYVMEQSLSSTSNTYGLGLFVANGVEGLGTNTVTPSNISIGDKVKTTVYGTPYINPVYYYSQDGVSYSKTVRTPYGIFDARNLMNYTTFTGGHLQADSDTPIYVVTMKVFSGDSSNHAVKELIELQSTLQ